MITALVLAGSRGGIDPVAEAAGVPHKALAEVAGLPMLGHVLAALAEVPWIGRILVIADQPDLLVGFGSRVELLQAAATPATSVQRAIDHLGEAAFPLLVTTADHPLLTPAMIEHFWARLPPDCAAAAAVARDEAIRRVAPDGLRTYWRFSDGDFSGCNLFALRGPQAASAVAYWRRLEADRKRPWRMVRHLGPLTLVRFLLGRVSLSRVVRSLGERVEVPLAAVELPFGEAAMDVDRPDDLQRARQILARRAKSRSVA